MHSTQRHGTAASRSLALLLALFFLTALVLGEGTKITAPKNSYKVAEDVKVGEEAAAQVRQEMPVLPENGEVDNYVERVGQVLIAVIPAEFRHPGFRYEFSVVNARDINAFALPGGPMFVNRGMIEVAHSEGEMAGVMAHELSHVVLRHGTAQASKSQSAGIQLGALGGAILGAIIGGNVGDAVAQGSQIGLGTYLLKFSREYETQADILGSQLMALAGYDPKELANMFKTIEQQGGSSGPQWLSDHPNPANRYERIAEEAGKLTIAPHRRNAEQEFLAAQSELKRMAPAPTMEEIARSQKPATANRPDGNKPPDGKPATPSGQYRTFNAGSFRISVPDNWKDFAGNDSVTFAPAGAYGVFDDQTVFTHGAIAGVTSISSNDLAKVSDQFVAGILHENSYLQVQNNAKRTTLGGKSALKRSLTGTSPVTRQTEAVDVYTCLFANGRLFYLVQVVPESERSKYKNAMEKMLKSLSFAS